MNIKSSSCEPMQVMMMPDYRRDNPYQTLLSKALKTKKVIVHFPSGYRRVLPIFRAIKGYSGSIKVLHLHWLDPYLKGDNGFIKFIYCLKFLIDVLLIRWTGVKVIWTIHNAISHNSKFPRLELWTSRALVKIVDRVIVHNHVARDEIVRLYQLNPAKIAVIPHGHYREIYPKAIAKSEARRQLSLPESDKIYLNFGMLKPYKGIERLLQLWQENQSIFKGNSLLIAGKALDDSYGQMLTKQASETENVILHNKFVADEQIHLYFSAANVVVLPFERMLTSGSLILAMSYGKPIVAPRMGSIPETLGTADWLLYDPDDERGLLHAIKDSTQIDLDALERLVSESCDRLNWSAIAQKTVSIYQNY